MLGRRRLGQAGDTIVEVMIVLSILGLALSIAYATANRSLLNTRQAEENGQATLEVQSQLESIYHLAASDGSDCSAANPNEATDIFCQTTFCVSASGSLQTSSPCSSGLYTEEVYNCDRYTGGSPCVTTGPNAMAPDTFVAQASWPDVAGDDNDLVTQAYRIHPNE